MSEIWTREDDDQLRARIGAEQVCRTWQAHGWPDPPDVERLADEILAMIEEMHEGEDDQG
jgi:hypothetical protein